MACLQSVPCSPGMTGIRAVFTLKAVFTRAAKVPLGTPFIASLAVIEVLIVVRVQRLSKGTALAGKEQLASILCRLYLADTL